MRNPQVLMENIEENIDRAMRYEADSRQPDPVGLHIKAAQVQAIAAVALQLKRIADALEAKNAIELGKPRGIVKA